MLQIANIDSYSTNTKVKDNQLTLGFFLFVFTINNNAIIFAVPLTSVFAT